MGFVFNMEELFQLNMFKLDLNVFIIRETFQ